MKKENAIQVENLTKMFGDFTAVNNISFQVGIGINSGEMVGGSLGPEKRMEYTVIGDNVNVASRLTSIAKGGEILISKQTYESIAKRKLKVEEKGQVSVKGRRGGIKTFKVLSLEGDQYGLI